MNAGNPERSKRLKLTLSYLQFGKGGRTTAEIQEHTGSMAPATDISELRCSGYVIDCKYEGKTPSGRRVYRYVYLGRIPA